MGEVLSFFPACLWLCEGGSRAGTDRRPPVGFRGAGHGAKRPEFQSGLLAAVQLELCRHTSVSASDNSPFPQDDRAGPPITFPVTMSQFAASVTKNTGGVRVTGLSEGDITPCPQGTCCLIEETQEEIRALPGT